MEEELSTENHHIINNITRTLDHFNNNNNNCNNNNWASASKNISIEIFEDLDPNFCQAFDQDVKTNPGQENGCDTHKTGNDNPAFKLQICKSLCELERNLHTGSGEDSQTGNEESKLKAHVCYCSQCGLGPEYLQFVKNTNL